MKINSTPRLTILGISVIFLGYAADSSAITWVDATDSQLQQGMPIKAAHVKEIRDKMTWDRNGANTFFNTGSVGVGISTPSQKLDVYQGALEITGTSTSPIGDTFGGNTQQSYIHFPAVGGSNDPGYIMHETRGAESNEGVLHLAPSDDNSYGDYVSIHGTNDPDRLKLHTDGTIEGVTNFRTINADLTGRINTNISVSGVAWAFEGKEFIRKMTDRGGARVGADDSIVIGSGESPDTASNSLSMGSEQTYLVSDNDVYIYTDLQGGWGGRDSFVFKDNGRMGVGTTSPGQKLDVVGTAQVDYLMVNPQDGTNEGGEIRLDGAGSNTTWYFDNYAGRLRFHHDGSERFTIRNNGRVGIGTSSPGAPLHVAGNIIANNPTANNHVATKSYVDAQVISGGDNLGNHIGTQDLVFNNYGIGIVGSYSSYRYQNLFSMGTAYTPADNGTSLGNMYGIAYTHSNVGGESIPGLGHQALFVSAGDTRSAVGHGIWTKYDITGNRFMDQNSSSYYLDPNSVSYLNDVRANIMYDRNNTGYYVNPASTTNLNNLYVQGNELGVNGELYACGSAGCNHFAYNNGGGTNYIRGNTYFNGIFYDENNTGYYVNPASTSIYNDLRANIFYDNNNTSYYLNPNSVSYLNDVRPNIIYDRNNTGYYWNGDSTTSMNRTVNRLINFHGTGGNSGQGHNHYGIYQESGGWSHPYPDLVINYHTGIKYVGYYNYGGHRFYTGYHSSGRPTTEALSIGNGDHNTRVNYDLYVNGTTRDGQGRSVRDSNGGWVRTYGHSGWYNGSYGGGWYMQDSTWIRTYGNKSIYHNTGTMRTDGTFEVGPSGNRFRVLTNGRVGVGKSSPGERLDINGSAKADAFLYNSDARLKTNVKTVAGLDIIKQLRGVTFDWKNNGKASVGLIAQEVEPIVPEAVKTSDTDGYKTVDYAKLVAPLIEAVKEQQAQIEAQQAEIEALKAVIN